MTLIATRKELGLQVYLDQVRSLPFVESVAMGGAGGGSAGVEVTLAVVTHTKKKYAFDVGVLRTHLSMAEVERWTGKARLRKSKRPILLLAPYVSRPMGARLREAGVQYLDQVGNMHLTLSQGRRRDGAFETLVEGKRPRPATRGDAGWRAPAYQVLLALLVYPELIAASVRAIAAQAGVSTSPVLQVQKKLLQNGLAVTRHGQWQWTAPGRKRARELWLHGYHATLRPHLLIGRFRARTALAPERLEEDVESALRGRCALRWGGAAAASRLDPYYRGDRTVVHVDDEGLGEAALAGWLRMLPDPEGPLLVLRVPGPCALESPDPNTVHPLLVWAELLEEGHDRASEAAERIARSLLEESR